ncbi:hypothetical protein [Streptomyces sp. SAI-229]|uniref:hypothetical protein n=1 Tax=Streptomyces sp. SAI-229 TaxID=3377731 RepID=UPI003C7C773D
MAWRDRLRRRAAGPSTAGRSGAGADRGANGVPAAAAPGDGPGPAAPGGSGPAVPADWDGGWRRTAAPPLTVSRAPLGVSDGLSFRAGLAAWQNPSFDGGLGHALLPDAPTGLVRGVTRPAAPRATGTGGGPLLLRAVREEGDGPQAGAPDAVRADGAASATPVARRVRSSGSGSSGSGSPGSGSSGSRTSGSASSGSGAFGPEPSGPASPGPASPGPASSGPGASRGGSGGARAAGTGSGAQTVVARSADGTGGGSGTGSPGGAPRTRGITSSTSPAVLSSPAPAVQRAVAPGGPPVVAPSDSGRPSAAPPIPLVRRVSVVPGASAGGAGTRPASGAASSASSRTPSGEHAANPGSASGPSVRRTVTGASPERSGGGRPEASRAPDAEASRPVARPRPVGPRLTVARRVAVPVRPCTRPAHRHHRHHRHRRRPRAG